MITLSSNSCLQTISAITMFSPPLKCLFCMTFLDHPCENVSLLNKNKCMNSAWAFWNICCSIVLFSIKGIKSTLCLKSFISILLFFTWELLYSGKRQSFEHNIASKKSPERNFCFEPIYKKVFGTILMTLEKFRLLSAKLISPLFSSLSRNFDDVKIIVVVNEQWKTALSCCVFIYSKRTRLLQNTLS